MSNKNRFMIRVCLAVCMTVFWCSPMHADAAVSRADQSAYLTVFDPDYYYNTYPDVAAAFGKNEKALLEHFIKYGISEGRNANAEFNPKAYRERYADLQAAFGDDMKSYCTHYMSYGKTEGRDGSAGKRDANGQPAAATVQSGQQIGTYTTSYKATIARATNVELAAQRINGVVLQPGDSFSFSETILPRTSENGYVAAPVILDKKYVSGMGGGICQVSSTLYAAMVCAGLPATERHPHSLPVAYLPAGLDATISGNTLDLKFDNIYSQPLKIEASAVNGSLTVSLVLVQ